MYRSEAECRHSKFPETDSCGDREQQKGASELTADGRTSIIPQRGRTKKLMRLKHKVTRQQRGGEILFQIEAARQRHDRLALCADGLG